MKRTRSYLVILLLIAASLVGCASSPTSFVRSDVDYSFIRTVAVFPFANRTPDVFAGQRVYSVFVSELLQTGHLHVIEEGQVLGAMRTLKLDVNAMPSAEQIVALGKMLTVDAIFFGSVDDYGSEGSSGNRVNAVTLSASLAETQTGSLVWQCQVHRDGSSIWRKLFGGGSASLYDVTRGAVNTVLGTLF